MKLLILAGMVIVFISVFFILFILDDMSGKYLTCSPGTGNKIVCSINELGPQFVFSMLLMGVFVLIDCLVVYFLFKALVVKSPLGYAVNT